MVAAIVGARSSPVVAIWVRNKKAGGALAPPALAVAMCGSEYFSFEVVLESFDLAIERCDAALESLDIGFTLSGSACPRFLVLAQVAELAFEFES
jgi:hypothetical protein